MDHWVGDDSDEIDKWLATVSEDVLMGRVQQPDPPPPQSAPKRVVTKQAPPPIFDSSVKTSPSFFAPFPGSSNQNKGAHFINRPDSSKGKTMTTTGKRLATEVKSFDSKEGSDSQQEDPETLEKMFDAIIEESDVGLDQHQCSIVQAAKRGRNCFLTGQAGTGKSRVLKVMTKEFAKDDRVTYMLAHNGVAAANINGMTIHAYCGISGTSKPPYSVKSPDVVDRIRGTQVLIIDEISTVDNHMLSGLDLLFRQLKKNMSAPFGGIQIIACGDFAQLKPIDDSKKQKTFLRNARRKGEDVSDYAGQPGRDAEAIAQFSEYLESAEEEVTYCFMSKAWKYICQEIFMLTNIYRQSDPRYLKVLSEIRAGSIGADTREVLTSRMVCNVDIPGHDYSEGFFLPEEYVMLYSRRADVDEYNQKRMKAIRSDLGWNYKALDRAANPKLAFLLNNFQVPEQILIKVGSRVMLKKNMHFGKGLVNGRCGRVIGFSELFVRQLSTGLFRPIDGCVINRAMEPNEKPVTPSYEVQEGDRAPLPEKCNPGSVCPRKVVDTIPKNLEERHASMGPSDPDLQDFEVITPQRVGLLRGNGFFPLPVVHFDHGEVIVLTPLEWSIEEQRKMTKKKMNECGIERTDKKQIIMDKVKLVSRVQVPLSSDAHTSIRLTLTDAGHLCLGHKHSHVRFGHDTTAHQGPRTAPNARTRWPPPGAHL
jgi:hypothetical protein